MEIAVVSLCALVIVVIISCINQRLNPGLLALLATTVIGIYLADLSMSTILSFFPANLFILLVSMSLVFGTATLNGTLDALTQRAVHLIKGEQMLLPILIFAFGFVLSAMGPGNIVATAVLAPMAMILAKKHQVSEILIAIMLCTGANAGAFSPFAPTGIIAIGLLEQIGLSYDVIWIVFGASAVLQSISAVVAYAIFLLRTKKRRSLIGLIHHHTLTITVDPLQRYQKITMLLIAVLLLGVLMFEIPLIMMAIAIALTMFALGLADEEEVLKTIPWGTILMVTGIAVLIGLMEKTGGLDLATTFIASTTSSASINSVLALITGIVSAYSSSSGVVMPAFIPLIPGLAAKMQITEILPMVIAVAVGSHMVDVSPLSTLGALSIAAVEGKAKRERMFKFLLIWGMSMSVVGGILAFVFLDLLYVYSF